MERPWKQYIEYKSEKIELDTVAIKVLYELFDARLEEADRHPHGWRYFQIPLGQTKERYETLCATLTNLRKVKLVEQNIFTGWFLKPLFGYRTRITPAGIAFTYNKIIPYTQKPRIELTDRIFFH